MRKISKTARKAYSFWKDQVKKKEYIVEGKDFPDEYVRKLLQQEDLVFTIKRGLYLLKNKGRGAETLFYQLYWSAVVNLVKVYEPWSIEKETALGLYLGDESVPQTLKVRTARNVKHVLVLPFGLRIHVRPDPSFKEKTCRKMEVGAAQINLDIPEKVLLGLGKRKGIKFMSFIKSVKFNRRFLEVLYAASPKPVRVRELIKIANRVGRNILSRHLNEILKEYTIYR